jgi:DedD protein
VVQVIALADAGRAKEMQEKIAAAGIKSYTEVVKTAKGEVTRVRAGPFATRQQAEKARDQLKALGLSGNIATR